jgi:DnaD/phage-associated family protein
MLLESQQQGYTETLYFCNSGRGKSLAQAFESGEWLPGEEETSIFSGRERRTIFQLYEDNIGPLTPLIADALRDAETTYQKDWISEAIQIAVENNVRRWKYIEAILASWKKEGRHAQTNRDYEESYRKYFQEED